MPQISNDLHSSPRTVQVSGVPIHVRLVTSRFLLTAVNNSALNLENLRFGHPNALLKYPLAQYTRETGTHRDGSNRAVVVRTRGDRPFQGPMANARL